MRIHHLAILAVLGMSLLLPEPGLSQNSKKPAKAAASAQTKAKAPVRKRARRPVRRRAAAKRSPAPANQRVPTKERYAEIQQALADAGHFTAEPNGVWTQDSIEALKSFQAEQGFEPTGKIDSRSLIKLGLGPRYGSGENAQAAAGDHQDPG